MATRERSVAAAVRPIPEGYHTVTPYLVVPGVAKVIDFVKRAFEATEIGRFEHPNGGVMHAEVKIGDSIVMMGEPHGDIEARPAVLHLYVEDVDTSYRRALEAGARSLREPADQFYGDRSAGVQDPAGNQWWLATHGEDVSVEEMRRRSDAASH